MNFEIKYHELVIKQDIPELSSVMKNRIKNAIENKLMHNPLDFSKPLRRSLKNYRKLRIGDYRVIFQIDKNIIKIFIIQHRSVIYKHATKRI